MKPPPPHVVCRGHIKLEIRLHMLYPVCTDNVDDEDDDDDDGRC